MIALLADSAWAGWPVAVLGWVGSAVLYGSLAAALGWMLSRTVLRGAPVFAHVALWLVVLLKFVMPVGPGWSFSLAHQLQATGLLLSEAAPATVAPPTSATAGMWVAGDGQFIPLTQPPQPPVAAPAGSSRTSWLLSGVALAYFIGVALVARSRISGYLRFVRERRDLPLADPATCRVVEAVAQRLGRRAPMTRISAAAPAPYIYGVLRPTLVLSPRQLGDRAELEAIIAHELAHLRRGDLWLRLLQWLAGTLLFFWPVVAWVNRRLDLAREQACDEWALRHGPLSAGQYARCLLKAAQPMEGACSFRPAAMASNLEHVERRIEMILNPRSSARRSGLVAGGVALAWGGFVLTGAARPPQNTQETAPKAEEAEVTILGADGGEFTLEPIGDIMFMGDDIMSLDAMGPGMVKIFTNCDGDDARFSGVWVGALNAGQLAEFRAAHPSADADGDGAVSAAEHDAYYVALALENAPALLAKYPKVDRNADGTLLPEEAARFVVGGLMIDTMPKPPLVTGRWVTKLDDAQPGENNHEVRIELKAEASADGTLVVTPIVAGAKAADGADCVRVVEVGKGDGAACMVTAAGAELPVPPTRWLTENTSGAPTTAQVAKALPVAVQAPLNLFLELNPEADANGDGKLTAEERDEFVQRHQTRMRTRMLERHPEADTNGDGLLTDEEARTFRPAFQPTGDGVHKITLRATRDGENVTIEQNGETRTVVVQPEKP